MFCCFYANLSRINLKVQPLLIYRSKYKIKCFIGIADYILIVENERLFVFTFQNKNAHRTSYHSPHSPTLITTAKIECVTLVKCVTCCIYDKNKTRC